MNPVANTRARQAFTLIELLVVVVVVGILLAMLLPAGTGNKQPATQIRCKSNLRQIGIGFWLYRGDNSNQTPWQAGSGAADCFLKLVPYLRPDLFICPADKARTMGSRDFSGFSNTNLSYFASILTTTTNPHSLLAGDRHLAINNQPVKPGLFLVTNSVDMSWTKELHFRSQTTVGLLLFEDGHAESTKSKQLPDVFAKQALGTTRLMIP